MLQIAWKHKSAFLERRAVGLISIPDLFLFGAMFSLFAPIADIANALLQAVKGLEHPEQDNISFAVVKVRHEKPVIRPVRRGAEAVTEFASTRLTEAMVLDGGASAGVVAPKDGGAAAAQAFDERSTAEAASGAAPKSKVAQG